MLTKDDLKPMSLAHQYEEERKGVEREKTFSQSKKKKKMKKR